MTEVKKVAVTLIPGDGIGPEITAATKKALAALGAPIVWEERYAGEQAFRSYGDPLPKETLDSIASTRYALKGPLSTPSGGGYRSATVQMREKFKLFGNVRPAKTLFPGRFENVDIILVRENLQGLYAAKEMWISDGVDEHATAVATAFNNKGNLKRLIRFTANMAIEKGRQRVTVVHKANILKMLSGIFLEALEEVRGEFPTLVFDDMIVDACAMKLVMRPEAFDVIVTTNLFGDILSDLIAGLVGGLGVTAGANMGKDVFLFEAVHGSAPDIAGKGIANPSAMMMAAAMLLGQIGSPELAERLRFAISDTISAGQGTADVYGRNNTEGFTNALIERL
jgi:isocitrate dehydrogenase (NAD+)